MWRVCACVFVFWDSKDGKEYCRNAKTSVSDLVFSVDVNVNCSVM